MQKTKKCTVCENYPDEVITQVNSMMLLANASVPSIIKFFEEDMELKAPTRTMIQRHRELQHHVPALGKLSDEEHTALKKINGNAETKLFNHIATQITVRTLPKLAMIEKNIDIMEEKTELFVFQKSELATEMEAIKNRPIIVTNPLTEEEFPIYPLTKNAKELMRMMGTQLDSIEKTVADTKSIKVDVSEDLMFAFMQLLGQTQLTIHQATNMVYHDVVAEEDKIKEIEIEDE